MSKPRNVFKNKSKSGAKQKGSKGSKKKENKPFRLSNRVKNLIGLTFLLLGLYLLLAFFSYLFTWKIDQDAVFQPSGNYFANADIQAKNILGKLGAYISHLFFYQYIGVSSFLLPFVLLAGSFYFFSKQKLFSLGKTIAYSFVAVVLISLITSFLFTNSPFPWGGHFGNFTNNWLISFIGKVGTGLLYLFSLLCIVFSFYDFEFFNKKASSKDELIDLKQAGNVSELQQEKAMDTKNTNDENVKTNKKIVHQLPLTEKEKAKENEMNNDFEIVQKEEKMAEGLEDEEDLRLELEEVKEEKQAKHFTVDTEYDPTLELQNYRFPNLSLLEDHGEENIEIDREELEKNKDQIVQTLKNYNIDISKIKATVGPTVTLYEIVPAPGVRISRIKNLEDDIALSLAALGIRIIAPIPGKGTIGIEVPSQHPNIVSMKSMLGSEKFVNSKQDLPVAIGKTISNENYIADLAKMPHLLIAGATGQGKSVGINALIVSLLYKKHPSELKFVLIDPKKVELSIYNKIENHYLAKLPGEEEAIITDTTKVVNTLNSLCIEMDERYDLLKNAHCRNIKEYNNKFKNRKLNPEKGHRFLPYIVLVVDEFADLIMTAGKEVESPIARLAQLARAVGIHLIIATQRPSVNIITGIIKANFPARIAFKVTSKVDSRTILDMGGADQLIGRGDLILSIGSDSIRLQCPFVDTPEVDKITSFIAQQKSFGSAHILPEYSSDSDSPGSLDDGEELDEYFNEAAKLVVSQNSGSTSMLQRKFRIGYNRAGRIMDQLERIGIVGASNGSKPREVLFTSEMELEQYLENHI